MAPRLTTVLEKPIEGLVANPQAGTFLARVVEAHPILSTLMDFCTVDPLAVAVEVGMVSPHEEDGAADLDDIDFGPQEWFEPSAGLAAVRVALRAVREDPQSLAASLYDPGLHPDDVISDLEAIERVLLLAQQHETRFHFVMER